LIPTGISAYVVHVTSESLDGKFPKYTHGAGASLDLEVALIRAITECCQLRVSQKEIKTFMLKDEEFRPYYAWGNGKKKWVHNLICKKSDPSVNLSHFSNHATGNFKDDILMLANEISELGHSVYVINLSRFEDFKVARVIVTSFLNTVSSEKEIKKKLGRNNYDNKLFKEKIKMFS
jgi:thioglycine synthase